MIFGLIRLESVRAPSEGNSSSPHHSFSSCSFDFHLWERCSRHHHNNSSTATLQQHQKLAAVLVQSPTYWKRLWSRQVDRSGSSRCARSATSDILRISIATACQTPHVSFPFTTINTVIGASGIIEVVPWHHTCRRMLLPARCLFDACCRGDVAAWCNAGRYLLIHIYYNR